MLDGEGLVQGQGGGLCGGVEGARGRGDDGCKGRDEEDRRGWGCVFKQGNLLGVVRLNDVASHSENGPRKWQRREDRNSLP